MRAAPPVEVQLGSGRRERGLLVVLHALAGGQLTAWFGLLAGWPWPWISVAVLASAGLWSWLGAWVARRSLPADPCRLRWDGRCWTLPLPQGQGDGLPVRQLQVAIDLGPWVLLRLHTGPAARRGWAVADVASSGSAWPALRRALMAHAGASAAPRHGGPAG